MSYDYSGFEDKATPVDLLSRISALATDQLKAEAAVEEAEKALETRKAELRQIAEVLLPALMEEAQMADFTTASGLKVTVKENIRASIPAARQAEAFAWLQAHDHADLIKREVKLDFDRNQEDECDVIMKEVAAHHPDIRMDLKRSVNPMTLSSFVRERLEAGDVIPQDVFGVFRQKASKIKVPKD